MEVSGVMQCAEARFSAFGKKVVSQSRKEKTEYLIRAEVVEVEKTLLRQRSKKAPLKRKTLSKAR